MPAEPYTTSPYVEWEHDGPGEFNAWCLRCRSTTSGRSAGEVDTWANEHGCICPRCDYPDHEGDCPEEETCTGFWHDNPDPYRSCAACGATYDPEPTEAQMEAMNNPDSGPVRTGDSPSYRSAMRDAGRGGLLR